MKISRKVWSVGSPALLGLGAAALLLGNSYGLSNLVGINLILASAAVDWGRSAYGADIPTPDRGAAKMRFWVAIGTAIIIVAVSVSGA